jgi:GPH family glycoside/pentoside/hexuronide:cation symporter
MVDALAAPSAEAAELRRQPLSLGFKALYGAGNTADAVTQAMLGTFLFFYLTAVCGMPNSLAGLASFSALILDSLIDPLVGSTSDNSWTRWGRRHPFMLAGAFPLAITTGLLFSIPAGLSGWPLFGYVLVISVSLRISHSMFVLPYAALGAELSDDYAERTNIVASRILFTVVGQGICFAMASFVFLTGSQGLLHRASYAPFGWASGALGLAGALIAVFGTISGLPRLHKVKPAHGPRLQRFARDMVEIFSNRSFVFLFGSLLLLFIGAGVAGTLVLHMLKFFWALPSGVIGLVNLASPVGILFGVVISVLLSNRFEKRSVVIVCFCLLVAYHGLVPLAKILGLLPEGLPLWVFLIGTATLVGAVVGCVTVSFQSMMADAADEHETLFGTRREGLYYAGLNFSAKAASGLGVLLAGMGMDLIHFPTNLAAKAAASLHIAAPLLRNLGLMYGLGVATIYGLATLIFVGYRLDRAACAKVQAILETRRAEVRSAVAHQQV